MTLCYYLYSMFYECLEVRRQRAPRAADVVTVDLDWFSPATWGWSSS